MASIFAWFKLYKFLDQDSHVKYAKLLYTTNEAIQNGTFFHYKRNLIYWVANLCNNDNWVSNFSIICQILGVVGWLREPFSQIYVHTRYSIYLLNHTIIKWPNNAEQIYYDSLTGHALLSVIKSPANKSILIWIATSSNFFLHVAVLRHHYIP